MTTDSILSETQKKKKQKFNSFALHKIIRVEIPAGGAAVTPPLGPVLGQYGMNTMEFCKEFNDDSKAFDKDTIIPTVIYLAIDKSFYFEFKTPGIAYFIKKYIESKEIEKIDNYYTVDKKEFLMFLYEVALFKLSLEKKIDNNVSFDPVYIKTAIRSMIGTARSFPIKFV